MFWSRFGLSNTIPSWLGTMPGTVIGAAYSKLCLHYQAVHVKQSPVTTLVEYE